MIPSALSTLLERGLADFLRVSFQSTSPGMERVVEDFLADRSEYLKGPYVSARLPFVASTRPHPFPQVPLGFPAHAHQQVAFDRLSRMLSTLVATGTGSGKTESFLVPILDHCREHAGPGVKAILIYPMNALATDQAERVAKLIWTTPSLKGTVRAGLYVGESQKGKVTPQATMGERQVITDRELMRQDPPDLLLTNYKMLDMLLLRPEDRALWEGASLRFLVVDELHTFDGAQGTDLACLVRRLKRRLEARDLCCIGTSATLGGDQASTALRAYATSIFGEGFDEGSVVTEQRQDASTFIGEAPAAYEELPENQRALEPWRHPEPQAWLTQQQKLWFGRTFQDAVDLGDALKTHRAFRSLVRQLDGPPRPLDELVESLARARADWRQSPALGRLAVLSLLSLAAQARSRDATGATRPFIELRLQLWQREMRRMVASLGERPVLRFSDDLDRRERARHLPLVHCKDCLATAWATRLDSDKPHMLRCELSSFYRRFFANDPTIALLYPAKGGPPSWPKALVDTEHLVRADAEALQGRPTLAVRMGFNRAQRGQYTVLSKDCPCCGAPNSLAIVGFGGAVLASTLIDQLFATPFNDDKRLLSFSDSVQDAAHRAGYFGARTWRTNLRIALARFLSAEGAHADLSKLAARLASTTQPQLGMERWVTTFLAPSMEWLHEWGALQDKGELPSTSDLPGLIEQRLQWECVAEFGLHARTGRSLSRVGLASVGLDLDRLVPVLPGLVKTLHAEVPGTSAVDEQALLRLVVRLLTMLRLQGGILYDGFPSAWSDSLGSKTFLYGEGQRWGPRLGPGSRIPLLLTDQKGGRYLTLGKGWSGTEVERELPSVGGLGADAASVWAVLLPELVRARLVAERHTDKGATVWGVDASALICTTMVARLRCRGCGHRHTAAVSEQHLWEGARCLGCSGSYTLAGHKPDYFGRLYQAGETLRIVSAEHTGLLDRADREQVEQRFKSAEPRPWYPNLLSCTPTLEMGIDIGDLSSVLLASVPPAQANYLQRIGRAGRRDGNSLVWTLAQARPHDLYFFAEPELMLAGQVEPPGVFLDAAAVLERQLTAFCMDQWVQTGLAEVPDRLQSVLAQLGNSQRFPHTFLDWVKTQEHSLFRGFCGLFEELPERVRTALNAHLLGDEGHAGLRWKLLDLLEGEKKAKESLRRQRDALRREVKKLNTSPAPPKDLEERIDALEREAEALDELIEGINRKNVLGFLTDEGLLPNYAFPESAVRLRSVIWRRRKKPTDKRRYQTWSYDYTRPPASAISELAPAASFYAGGRKVEVDRLDLETSKPESWRFCARCNHAEPLGTGDRHDACPACDDADWSDPEQKLTMVQLRQVFARSSDRDSRIGDDQDQREPVQFLREVQVDVKDEDLGGAWVIQAREGPYGFEYLTRATFRDINFGAPSDQGPRVNIGGREAIRKGFQVCIQCGAVKKRKGDIEHTFTCPSRRDGAVEKVQDCLYLYREFSSEAMRILLPVTPSASRESLNSFLAAVNLGLRTRFGGKVDHLRFTLTSEPTADDLIQRTYLVLFDTVPGGTGYIKELSTPPQASQEPPIVGVLEGALGRIQACECAQSGCYRCVYAYRNSKDMDDTSANRASQMLRDLLDHRDTCKRVDSLSQVSISSLLDSALEERFLETLRRMRSGGENAVLVPEVWNLKPCYRLTLGARDWRVEPQRTVDDVGVTVSIDFVLHPAFETERPPIAVFLDGWTFHQGRIGHDLAQRQALLRSGRWDVWTLTWNDLDAALKPSAYDLPALPLDTVQGTEDLVVLLQEDLTGDPDWVKRGRTLLASSMQPGSDDSGYRARRGALPAVVRGLLPTPTPVLVNKPCPTPWVTLDLVHDGTDLMGLLALDDTEPDRGAWLSTLRAFQLLRQVPGLLFTASDHASLRRLAELWLSPPGWDLGDVEPAFHPLCRKLERLGVPEPVVGDDLLNARRRIWATAELAWEGVAVLTRDALDQAQGEPLEPLTIFVIEDLDLDNLPSDLVNARC